MSRILQNLDRARITSDVEGEAKRVRTRFSTDRGIDVPTVGRGITERSIPDFSNAQRAALAPKEGSTFLATSRDIGEVSEVPTKWGTKRVCNIDGTECRVVTTAKYKVGVASTVVVGSAFTFATLAPPAWTSAVGATTLTTLQSGGAFMMGTIAPLIGKGLVALGSVTLGTAFWYVVVPAAAVGGLLWLNKKRKERNRRANQPRNRHAVAGDFGLSDD